MSHSRRRILRWLGISLTLPVLESTLGRNSARAADPAPPKKRFIGTFFPNGAAEMAGGAFGDFTFDGALRVLADRGVKQNAVLARGFRGQSNYDIHWSATAAFLSCNEPGSFTIAPPSPLSGERCGKSFDQYVADLERTKIRSLHAGWHTVSGWDEGHDSVISIRYVNSIAWRDERGPIQNTTDPRAMFTQVFGDGTLVADPHIQYLLNRKKSVLDGVIDQLKTFRRTISVADRPKMDAYETGIREVESEIVASMQANTCAAQAPGTTDPSLYISNFKAMQKMIVRSFQCNLTRAATIMYHEGIGDNSVHPTAPMAQHHYAHNDWEALRIVSRIQMALFADLLVDLKNVGLLEETIVVLGSNMSDGKLHDGRNIPLLVASAGPELKLGQEIYGTPEYTREDRCRNLSDLYMDLFPLFGIAKSGYGEGNYASTGRASNVLTT